MIVFVEMFCGLLLFGIKTECFTVIAGC